ncbi:peptidase family S49-domain-containing protein [Jimgerdemannia flammicorona]|uniref:Peptidase family S49-domain-containing protein n=1 Tax=Jimgerdemannia flammicorona TaxID=994334 RepID=A0A433QFL8_9FUNG|nr:peptidase family S49-domain-containing protein [Jimgerdemannia flammicorona]
MTLTAPIEAASDQTVDAIVLRIDSGGGDVVASDTIADAVKFVKEKGIPIVASFGNTSEWRRFLPDPYTADNRVTSPPHPASGGYYISTHCDRILASPSTLTGSIGVAALRPFISDEFFKWAGVNVEQIFKGSKSQSPFHDLTGDELVRYRRQVDAMYADFTGRVADGRHMDPAKVEEIARGKIWAASDAAQVGLIDELGGTYRAIHVAAELGLEKLKAMRAEVLGVERKTEKAHAENGVVAVASPRKLHVLPALLPEEVGEIKVKTFPAPKPFLQRLAEASRNEEADAMADAWVRDKALRVGTRLLAFALRGELEKSLGIEEEVVEVPRLEIEELRIR